MVEFDCWDDEFIGDDNDAEYEFETKPKNRHARQRYEKLMERKRLRKELEDDISYW